MTYGLLDIRFLNCRKPCIVSIHEKMHSIFNIKYFSPLSMPMNYLNAPVRPCSVVSFHMTLSDQRTHVSSVGQLWCRTDLPAYDQGQIFLLQCPYVLLRNRKVSYPFYPFLLSTVLIPVQSCITTMRVNAEQTLQLAVNNKVRKT